MPERTVPERDGHPDILHRKFPVSEAGQTQGLVKTQGAVDSQMGGPQRGSAK